MAGGDAKNLPALTLSMMMGMPADVRTNGITEWLKDAKNRRIMPFRLQAAGYTPVRNRDADDQLWKIMGKRQVIYARRDLKVEEQLEAARNLKKMADAVVEERKEKMRKSGLDPDSGKLNVWWHNGYVDGAM